MLKKIINFFLIASVYIQILSSTNTIKCPEQFVLTNQFAIVAIANTFLPHIKVIIASIEKYKNHWKVNQKCLKKLLIEVDELSTSPMVKADLEQCIGNGFYQIEDVALGACRLLWLVDGDLNLYCLDEPTCWIDVLSKLDKSFSMLQSLYITPIDLLFDVQRMLEDCVQSEIAKILHYLLNNDWEYEIVKCLN